MRRCRVVAVSGTSGAGKSTLVEALAAGLPSAVSLFFDDYAGVSDLPEHDLRGWLDSGGDPDEWRTPLLVDHLCRLRDGHAVEVPGSGRVVEPAAVVVLEEPFGRSRKAMAGVVDLAVHIDLPLGIALARRMLRDFLPADPTPQQWERARTYLASYLAAGGEVYAHIDALAYRSADVRLDGLQSAAALAGEAMAAVLLGMGTDDGTVGESAHGLAAADRLPTT